MASGNKVPSRPQISIPSASVPGELGHVDVEHFDSPSGKFNALVHADVFSLRASAAVLLSMYAESAVRYYISAVTEHYPTFTAGLGSLFETKMFKAFLN